MGARDTKRFDPAPSWLWDPARQRAVWADPEACKLFPDSFPDTGRGLTADDPVAALSNACHAALISTGAPEFGPSTVAGWRVTCRMEARRLERDALGLLIEISDVSPVAGGAGPAREANDALARAAHDLRTPLSAIVGFAEFIAASGSSMPEQTRNGYLGDIAEAGRFASRMALDLLTYASAGAAASQPEARADLARIIRDSIRLLELEAERRGVEIGVTVTLTDATVAADTDQISRAVGNLLGNAVTHSNGQVAVALTRGEDGALVLSVSDDGPGLSEEALSIALTPFGRVKAGETASAEKGVGLGLPIAQRFAEANGAQLRIETAPGAGLRACIVFPANADTEGDD